MGNKKINVIFLLIIVLGIAAFFRLYKLDSIPPGLYPDVAINGNDALGILQTGKLKVFYPENNGREGLFFWFIAFSFLIFGPSILAIKIVAAVFGILTVLGTYLLTKELVRISNLESQISNLNLTEGRVSYNSVIALLASFFVAISFWHVNFSRIGFRAILVPFILVFAFYFLLRGFNAKKLYNFIIAGGFFGLGFYTYISYRFVIFILAFVLFLYWRIYKEQDLKKHYIQDTKYLILTILIVVLPLGIYFFKNPHDFFSRASEVSIFSQSNPLLAFIKSLVVHLGMFNIYGDGNWRHNLAASPQLLWPVGIFFLIGFIISIKNIFLNLKIGNWKLEIGNLTLLFWFFFMLLPGILSYEGIPHALRTIGVIPVPYIFAAIGAYWLFKKLKKFYKTKFSLVVFYVLIGLFLTSLICAEFNKYFYLWANNPNLKEAFSENFVKIGNYLNSLSDEVEKYVIVNQSGVPVPYPNGIPMPAQTPMFIEKIKYGKIRTTYLLPEDLGKIKLEKKAIIFPLHYDESLMGEIIIQFPKGKLEKEQGIWVYKINNF